MFELGKLDPKALAEQFQTLVAKQVGEAPIKVELHKFEQTNPGYSNNRVLISFLVVEDLLKDFDIAGLFSADDTEPGTKLSS